MIAKEIEYKHKIYAVRITEDNLVECITIRFGSWTFVTEDQEAYMETHIDDWVIWMADGYGKKAHVIGIVSDDEFKRDWNVVGRREVL